MKEKNSKIAVLSEARERKNNKEAAARNSITLDKSERREISGFQARQREVDAMAAPLNADVREFMAEVQERYNVTVGVTHAIDFQSCELVPLPEKAEQPAPETAPEGPETTA